MKRYLLLFLILIIFAGCTAHANSPVEIVVKPCATYDIQINEPSYDTVLSLIKEVPQVEGNCCDKSKAIQNYFYDKGYQCYIVITNRANDDGHISVAFNTEQGWKYFEPETKLECPIALNEVWNPTNIVFIGSQSDPKNRVITQLTIMR